MVDDVTDIGTSTDPIRAKRDEVLKSIKPVEAPKLTPPEQYESLIKKETEATLGAAKKKTELELARADRESRTARELSSKYESQYKDIPEFKPTPESKADLIGLFGLIGAVGAFGGGKSYGSALGAMNAMGGMLKGYREGRKDLFEREKAEFDKNLTAIKAHNDKITAAFSRAKELAKTNLPAAERKLFTELKEMEANALATNLYKKGLMETDRMLVETLNRTNNLAATNLKIVDSLNKSIGSTTGIGAIPTLSRLIEDTNVGSIKPKEAQDILNRVNTVYNTERLINEANDPDINFGEISRFATRFQQAIRRNLESKDTIKSNTDAASAINQAADEAGMDPNDKNVVFFKKAIFTAMELEREARGGSILPVAMMKQLTPLLDPTMTTREAYVGILQDRERELRQKSGLTNQQLDKALGNLRKQFGTGSTSASRSEVVNVQSVDEAENLPSGTRFRLPDGRTGTVQ